MLNQEEALRLNDDLRGRKVLSVYLNGQETDPAKRRAWRVRLSNMVGGTRDRLAPASEERRSFDQALELIEGKLAGITGLLPERGWVAFATPERLWYAGASPAPMPDLVRWQDGVHVSPYVRALKQARPVTVVVADQRHARILRYQYGTMEEVQDLQADTGLMDSSAGTSKRPSTSSGHRGETRTDAARRMEEASMQRMLRDVLATISERGDDHLTVVAGNPEIAGGILRALPERERERAIDLHGVSADATDAELREAVGAAASALSIRLQKALVDRVIEKSRSDGRGALGRERTERALQAGAVETLLLSRGFARSNPDLAEHLVDLALDRAAAVEEIAEAAAAELDREGGVGARLRFAV